MRGYDRTPSDEGIFSTGRMMTLAVMLVIAGIAFPNLRNGSLQTWVGQMTGSVDRVATEGPVGGHLMSLEDRAKAVTTRTRLSGIKTGLRMWANQHGMPDANDLVGVVGEETATDAWGHRIRFVPPDDSGPGYLRSFGPDGKRSADDIKMPVSLQDLK